MIAHTRSIEHALYFLHVLTYFLFSIDATYSLYVLPLVTVNECVDVIDASDFAAWPDLHMTDNATIISYRRAQL